MIITESDASYRENVWLIIVGVHLALRGHFIANNSHVNIRSIGQHSNRALQCITDKSPSGCRHGEWLFPNGDGIAYHGSSFYRRGGDMHNTRVMSLNRPPNVMTPTGQFCCKMLDATFILQTHCVIIGKKPMAYYIIIIIIIMNVLPKFFMSYTQIIHQSLYLALPLLVKATLWSIP